ncbi:MAG TPA: lipid-binding SYLF domain-containing protein [Alphaproteobacteria bacterium]|nr:lipid-binding SYLF domain-containing protein [Alphaproteobacteria bacterium]
MFSRLQCILVLAVGLLAAPPAMAQQAEQEIVDKARLALEHLRNDPDHPTLNNVLARAKAVLIIPSLLKAGFILGGEGGSGVLLARGASGEWSAPAFYTLASGSIGLQIGAQDAEVLFAVMTDKGLKQVIQSQFKLGADASIAVGPKGGGVEASTTLAMGADIYAFSRARGAFAGGSFEGSFIKAREEWNKNYYGQMLSVEDIVLHNKASNPAARALQQALAQR